MWGGGGGVGKTKETINSTVSAGVTEASASQRNATLHKLMASSLHHNGIRMNVSRKMFHYDVQGSVKKKKKVKITTDKKKQNQKKNQIDTEGRQTTTTFPSYQHTRPWSRFCIASFPST